MRTAAQCIAVPHELSAITTRAHTHAVSLVVLHAHRAPFPSRYYSTRSEPTQHRARRLQTGLGRAESGARGV
jgi:hypothetical protein